VQREHKLYAKLSKCEFYKKQVQDSLEAHVAYRCVAKQFNDF
jgi:hypothetical protein